MTYLLDTCTLSTLRKHQTPNGKKLEAWVARHSSASYFISVLTIGEIQCGIASLPVGDRSKNALQDWLSGGVVSHFEGRILPVDQQVCSIWALMNARARRKGIILAAIDSLIAATAARHDLIVITQNVKHFRDAEVKVFDPLSE